MSEDKPNISSKKPSSPPAAKVSAGDEATTQIPLQNMFLQMENMLQSFMDMKNQFTTFQERISSRMDQLEQKAEESKFATPPVRKIEDFPSHKVLEEWGFNTIARIRQELPDPRFSEYVKDFDDENDQSAEAKEFRRVRKIIQFDETKRKDLKNFNPDSASEGDNITKQNINSKKSTKISNVLSKSSHNNDSSDSDAGIADYTKNTHQDINSMRKHMFSNKKKKTKSRKSYNSNSDDEEWNGSGSGSDGSNSSDEDEDYDKLSESRRNSTLGRIIRTSSKHTKKKHLDATKRGFLYMKAPPPFDGYLDALTPRKVYNFFHKILLYKTATGLGLEIALYISDEIRELLMSLYKGLTLEKFYSMSDSKLLTILQMESRPKTHIAFYNKLKSYTKFGDLPSNYDPSPLNFKPFYDGYITYKNKFIQMYDLMAEDNDINVPPLKNKEGGLIKLFLDKIPFGYGQQAYKSLVRANDDKENFKNIKDFIHKFGVFIEEHYRKYEENKSVAEHFVKDTKGYNEKANTSRINSSKRNNHNKFNNNSNSKYGKAVSLQHIDYHDGDQDSPIENSFKQEESASQSDNSFDEKSGNNEATDNPHSNNNDADSDFSEHNDAKADDEDRDVMHERLSELMLVDNNRKGSSSNSVGCRSMVFYNDCKSAPNCNFSHDVKALQKSHSYYSDLLNKSKFKPSTNGTGSSSLDNNRNQNNRYSPAASNKEPKLLLKRPKPPPPRDSRIFHHLAEADQSTDKL
jgi:hypothetical protein